MDFSSKKGLNATSLGHAAWTPIEHIDLKPSPSLVTPDVRRKRQNLDKIYYDLQYYSSRSDQLNDNSIYQRVYQTNTTMDPEFLFHFQSNSLVIPGYVKNFLFNKTMNAASDCYMSWGLELCNVTYSYLVK